MVFSILSVDLYRKTVHAKNSLSQKNIYLWRIFAENFRATDFSFKGIRLLYVQARISCSELFFEAIEK